MTRLEVSAVQSYCPVPSALCITSTCRAVPCPALPCPALCITSICPAMPLPRPPGLSSFTFASAAPVTCPHLCWCSPGGAFDIPGAARPADFASNDFLREFEQHEGMSAQHQRFDDIFEQGRAGPGRAPPGAAFQLPNSHETHLIEPCLQVS